MTKIASLRPATLYDWLILLIPTLGLISINFVGQLFIHELLLLFLLFLLLLKGGSVLRSPTHRRITYFLLLWIVSQVVTDLVRNSLPSDYLRGWSKLIFFGTSFLALAALISNERRAFIWLLASTIPLAIRPFLLFDGALEPANLWKFGVGASLLSLFSLPILWKLTKQRKLTSPYWALATIYFLFGFGSFFLNSRSFAALSILGGIITLSYIYYRGAALRPKFIAIAICACLITANLLASLYTWGASNGTFGEEAYIKYNMQTSSEGGALTLLLGGRSESLVAMQAISDSPLIGHGSWARNFYYVELLHNFRQQFLDENPSQITDEISDGLIPTHSYLFGSWVEAGIFGALFWIYILGWCYITVLPMAWKRGDGLGLFCVIAITQLSWNILFSPFGANVRVDTAATLAIFCIILNSRNRIEK